MSTSGLVPLARSVGGGGGRIGLDEVLARVRAAMAADWPSLAHLKDSEPNGALAICGGGPSVADVTQIKAIRKLQRNGAKVWAVNKTHDFLLTKGIAPDYACLLDPMPWVAGYIEKPQRRTIYAVASQCHAGVFAALKHARLYVWHAGVDYDGVGYPIPQLEAECPGRDWLVIPGPTTVGLRSILVGYALGFRTFHLFGLDSSMRTTPGRDAALHAYAKPKPADAPEGWVTLRTKTGEEKFFTNAHMARQALDFEDTAENIGRMVRTGAMQPVRLIVHGDGLLPSLAGCYGWRAA